MSESTNQIVINLENSFGYGKLCINKSEGLGSGSFGSVLKATLDHLPCAAKILHPEFFQHGDLGAQAFADRFHLECIILRGLKHPNIVTFLCVAQDPKDHLPILLMELMEESLTDYLEQAPTSLPHHVQVNIANDIALALEYLHHNLIIHRDLSSNNILLKGGTQVKVTDFGMSKIVDNNRKMTLKYRDTQCPGTAVFMSPEALRVDPRYSEKLDVFSLGVLMIQIITRKFPSPTKHQREKIVPSEAGYVFVPVPELERRKDDIAEVPSDHALRPIALNCIKDKDIERPNAAQLCETFKQLKSNKMYEASELEHKQRKISEQQQQYKEDEYRGEIAEIRKKMREHSQEKRQQQEKVDTLGRKLKHMDKELKKLAEEKYKREREVEELKHELEEKRRGTDMERERHTPRSREENAFFEAARRGDMRAVKELIIAGVKVDCTHMDGRTPLMTASFSGHADIVKLLIRATAHVNRQETNGWTALQMAAQEGRVDVVKVLIDAQADVNIQHESGQNALYIASLKGHLQVVQLLLRKHANVTLCKKNGASPLYGASQEGHNDIVKALIKKGADVNKALKDGATPLYMACHNGHSDVVKTLIRGGANPTTLYKGWRAVDIARAKRHPEIVSLLHSVV